MSSLESFLQPIVLNQSFDVLPLAGDASTRRYSRIVTDEKSWVLMEWEPFKDIQNFPFLSVQDYFLSHGIPVPKLLHLEADKGLFLLEDLGDLTLERKFWEFQKQKNILPYYKTTLDHLIKIHSLSFHETQKDCTAYKVEFSVEKLMWEFHYMQEHLFEKKWGLQFSKEESAALDKNYLDICEQLYSQPQVICHRDFHSRNVMIKHGKIFIIDFQDARMGPAAYDLVSLLWDSYVDLDSESRQDLIHYYCSNFPEFPKVANSVEDFLKTFDLQTLQRCLKACGSFASFYNNRSDKRYLKYLPKTLKNINTLLESFPQYSALHKVLTDNRSQWA